MKLTKEEFMKIKKGNKFSEGTEAKLYKNNNQLLKIYKKHTLENKSDTIDYILMKEKVNGCVFPNDKIIMTTYLKVFQWIYMKTI